MKSSTPAPALSSTLLEQIVDHIFATRCISRRDQQSFMRVALGETMLNPKDRALVDRVFEALRRGMLRVVD
ncbi:hypothetical protein P7L53_03970 [Thermoleptolyngbya sichuanensis XZ-Cy5]|uniref:hypothetical protein n=1 Tax=Thermoleptolyngbya sichuanensis TaxID=2885951 RepID=UPI00240D4D08|nr:hypothetical protein [Thermoleptolyngbya sichuanensis]MDG2615392.1 hypothetical protein [Thermoleptolyngbya sichuanensis XZ-Cy5]